MPGPPGIPPVDPGLKRSLGLVDAFLEQVELHCRGPLCHPASVEVSEELQVVLSHSRRRAFVTPLVQGTAWCEKSAVRTGSVPPMRLARAKIQS